MNVREAMCQRQKLFFERKQLVHEQHANIS